MEIELDGYGSRDSMLELGESVRSKGQFCCSSDFVRSRSRLLLPQVGAPPGQSNHSICKPALRPCLGN